MDHKIVSAPYLILVLALVSKYKVTSANICASDFTLLNSTSGNFSSPNYPGNYPHDTTKTWKIVAPVGQTIDLYFAVFSLERSNSCRYDYVKILDKCDDTVPKAMYCGRIARPVRSRSNVLWVEFRSDESENRTGFEAIYTTNSSKVVSCPRPSDDLSKINYCLVGGQVQCCNNHDSSCNVNMILSANTGTLTSPGYPGNYPNGKVYLWRITVPEGYVVQINFTTLVTHHSLSCSNAVSKCNCDYVHVLDGPCTYNFGPRWCGAWTSRNKYPSFITTGRHMLLIFKSDNANNDVGFRANFRRALKCSGETPYSCLQEGIPACCKDPEGTDTKPEKSTALKTETKMWFILITIISSLSRTLG